MIKVLDDRQVEGEELEIPVDELQGKLEAWLKTKPK